MDKHSAVNRLYRLVWNESLMIWTAVAECAKGRGKRSSAVRRHHRSLLLALSVGIGLGPLAMAGPNDIRPDGRTETRLSGSGNVTDVHTATFSGGNAFNSFSSFGVGAGQVVNLHVPIRSANLINLVSDHRTTVDGILNSIKGRQIGGKVFFASPLGFVVGAGGVVNVGSLTVTTPSRAFVNSFFLSPGVVDEAAAQQLLDGTAPPSEGASIEIDGEIHARGSVRLHAGSVSVGGAIYRGARFVGAAPDFSDVVNANGLAGGTRVVEQNGRIEIVADTDVTVSGSIESAGSEGMRGGAIDIQAGNDLALQAGALISAAGSGTRSAGGTVNMLAANNAVIRTGAMVDASGGSSGRAGAIEFSALNNVELAGGQFKAEAATGPKGTVLIDPDTVTVSGDFYSGGAHHVIEADNTITVNAGVVVSTRNVGGPGANQLTAASAGDSGNLTLTGGHVVLNTGSALVAHADGGFSGGDITITATRAAGGSIGGGGTAGISATGATIQGAAVSLNAESAYGDSAVPVSLPLTLPTSTATVNLTDTSISASGALTIGAKASVDTTTLGSSPIGTSVVNASASVTVGGASVLSATGAATLSAESSVKATVTPTGLGALPLPADASVAISTINSSATVVLGGSSSASSGAALGLSAKNTVEATTVADATGSGTAVVGGSVAVTVLNTVTQASIEDTAHTQSASLTLGAESKNTVLTRAKAAAGGAKKQTDEEKAASASQTEKALDDFKEEGRTSAGSVNVAAAVAVASINSRTQAQVVSSALQNTTGLATVSSVASNSSTVDADGSTVGDGAAVGVGAAFALNIGTLTNTALVGDNARLQANGLSLQALMPAGETNAFSTSSKSGAGASNVGVAGSLAINTLAHTTTALLQGDSDSSGTGANVNAGTGAILIEAGGGSTSSVSAGADVKGVGDSAKVGVGASIGVNVAANKTVAEVGDQAVLTGGAGMGLNASSEHRMDTTVEGGAAGAGVAVTPLVAVSVADTSTVARLGASASALDLSGAYSSTARHSSEVSTVAKGQTQGNDVSVGVSLALGIANDKAVASVERDIAASTGVSVAAVSVARSDTTATASVAGGQKADENGDAPPQDGGAPGQSVDEQVAEQGDAAKDKGKANADKAPDAPETSGGKAGGKLDTSVDANKTGNQAGKAETSEGGVSVAAAVGVNVASSETTASIGAGRSITGSGALSVTSTAETDAKAAADGSQSDAGGTGVGIGAAVAVNAATASNTAIVSDGASVHTRGLTIQAGMDGAATNDFAAESKSGAGAGNVGVAGSLAINVVANTSTALLQGDTDSSGSGASVNAGTGAILIEAGNASTSSAKAEADVEGTDEAAKVGVGASIAVNVVANKTVAEVADRALITGGAAFGLNARSDHTMDTSVEGGAAGAKTSVTPVVAVSVGDNTTLARLGTHASALNLSGAFSSTAEHRSEQTTVAKGQTQGSEVAVGASIAVGIASDTVIASVERDITASTGVSVAAVSVARSDTSATASVAGGQKADENGDAPPEDDGAPGKSVDEQVAAQGDSAKGKGKANADKAPAAPATSGGKAGDKLDTSVEANKTGNQAGKAEADSNGDGTGESVGVAAAVGINVANAETTASVGAGRSITSSGALGVSSTAETDAKALADGKTVAPPAEEGSEAGAGPDVGVGVAVAVNVATARSSATVGSGTVLSTQGLTVQAGMDGAAKNEFLADATSGAGAAEVGVAGSLAINIVDNSSRASLGGGGSTADAGSGAIRIEAGNVSTSTAKAAADVKVAGDDANVGVGASVGVNVAVNRTVAEVADQAALVGGASMAVNARADHTMSTELVGGSAGAKTSITPVVAVSIAVNTTQARVGESATGLSLSGAFSSSAEQSNTLTTTAKAQAQGDTAVGASLAAAIAVDDVSAELMRDIDSSSGVELLALSQTSITTETTAGAKGAKKAKTNASSGEEEPETNSTVDEQKKNQLDFAKDKNAGASGVNTDTDEAKTPNTSSKTPGTDKPTQATEQGRKDQQGSKISVAAAIGVSVARNQGRAQIGQGLSIDAGSGELRLDAQSDTNYSTTSSGEAVSEDDAVGVAVAVTATHNLTQATLGAGTSVTRAGDVNISAGSRQNRDAAFQSKMSAEAVSGASGGGTAVAGGLALVVNENRTLASIDEGATLGSLSDVGQVSVAAEDTSKISALARSGALSKGGESKTGVGASFAVLVSLNQNHAVVGRDADDNGSFDATEVNAESLSVKAARNRVSTPAAKNFTVDEAKNLDFLTFKPSDYLASNNYYTEAIAGAASQGDTAVAGAFAVNVFTNKSVAELGEQVSVTTSGSSGPDGLGVEVSSLSDMQSVTIAGAAAGAKQTGVGISNADTVNLDETRAAIGAGSSVVADGANAGVRVQAESLQEMTNVGVSAGASTSGTAVAGVLGVVVALGETEASIGDGASVKAMGDVSVKAHNDVDGVMIAGGVAGANQTGVGASISAHILSNTTSATIGDADVSSAEQLTVAAQAAEHVSSFVLAGTGAGTTGIAGALSVNVIVSDTSALIGQDAQVNTDALYSSAAQGVAIKAQDDTTVLAITGSGAGGGTTGVGAALDTTVFAKTVKAGIEDDTDADGETAVVNATKDVLIDAVSSEDLTSVTVGFGGGGTTGVGGAVSIAVVKNDVQARIGTQARVDADGNVGVNAEDGIKAVLAAGGVAGGGTTGVGGSIGVATLLGSTRASIGNAAEVNARGLGDARLVYSGETVQTDTSIEPADLGARKTELAEGLSVTAYTREELITTVFSAGGGGTTGVAATVSADVIASTTEASIGEMARINASNAAAGAPQEVRVKAIGETSLINTVGGAAGGGSAGVGAGANVGVISKTITAQIGKGALVNARQAVEVQAASLDSSLSTTLGLAGGGSVGVGGAVAGVGIANTVRALIEDGTSVADAAQVNVSGGDLSVTADAFAKSWMVSGGAGGGGSAGVGASLSVAVNASSTQARIGDFAETNASGLTSVHADSTESVNTVTVAGAGGGSAGIAGSIAVNVVTSNTEASIGSQTRVNQDVAGQGVEVKATDRIESLSVTGAVGGGGAAGVGAAVSVTVAQNTTQASIGDNALVSATQDIAVEASSDKSVDSVAAAGAGGGSAGVAGAISIVSVGMRLDGDSKDGLGSTVADTDAETDQSKVGNLLGDSQQARDTKTDLDASTDKLAVGTAVSDSAPVPDQNTIASIGAGATVNAGRDVTVAASDTTDVLQVGGGAAGGGAAGVAGTLGVTLLRDSAAATVGDGAQVDAGRTLDVNAQTAESVLNIGVSAAGGGAAGVSGSVAINVIASETVASIGAARINQQASATGTQSVLVRARSDTELITVAGSGGGGGAAAVGGVVNVNTLSKETTAQIGEGAQVDADLDVRVAADSQQQIIGAGISVQGSGAASVGGAAAVNVIDNSTQAFIGSAHDDDSKTAADVDSDGNVAISAADDTLLMGVSASATGSGIAAVGGAVGVNVITSETLAYLGDTSSVNARGNATDGALVYTGAIDQANARNLPAAPAGKGDLDVDGDGVADGDVSNGASFDVGAQGSGGKDASDTSNPETTRDSQGNAIAGIAGGLGTRGTERVKGFSVTAVGSEKIVTASLGVAAAGAAGVTGTVTANVISSVTRASIGDGAQVNTTDAAGAAVGAAANAAGADASVRVRAQDDTLVVMASGTLSAGIAAVSGSVNTAVVDKQTSATIGDADVKARQVEVQAKAEEDLFLATANVAVGVAGIGAAVSVASVANTTTAGINAGANVDASGDLRVTADQLTDIDTYTLAGSGGVVGVSGAVGVGVVNNTTRAYVEGAALPADAAVLNAGGTTEVAATSNAELSSVTGSAAVGGVGVAGSVGVKVLTSTTTASIGNNTRINQTRGGAAQDVKVSASDTVDLKGGGLAGAAGGIAFGVMSDTNIVRNTTTASIGNGALVDADRDVGVTALSSKNVGSIALAAAAGGLVGGAISVSVAVVGASLDAESQRGLGDGATADRADDQAQGTGASDQLDDVSGSQHLAGAKSTVNGKAAGLGVKSDMNDSSVASQDKTQAFIGSSSRVTAGGQVDVTASDQTQLDLRVVGAAAGGVGAIGAAVGVGISNSTTEAFVGEATAIDAAGDVNVAASAGNLDASGSRVHSTAGAAGGIVGASAAVSVQKDTSTTRAFLGNNASIERADEVLVNAETDRIASATTIGAAAGGLAIGASVAQASFDGSTSAYVGSNADVGQTVGKTVGSVVVVASDGSRASASATAGAAGILSGSGADADATVDAEVTAYVDDGAELKTSGGVSVEATGTAQTRAEALGVNIGAGSVGASLAKASSNATIEARLGAGSTVEAATLEVAANRLIGSGPTAAATAFGATGGLLFGINATRAEADSTGRTSARVGDNATLLVSGATQVEADSHTLQVSSGVGISVGGLLAVGADVSEASSDTVTEALLGNGVKLSGASLTVDASGNDTNYAHGKAGSGGLVSAPFSRVETSTVSRTTASTGSGNNDSGDARKIDVGALRVEAGQHSQFDAWIDSTNASLVGVSGAKAINNSNASTVARLGPSGYLEADSIRLAAHNEIDKAGPASGVLAGIRDVTGDPVAVPAWNVDSASGGLVDVPAAGSSTGIVNNATVEIGASTHLEQTGSVVSPGAFKVDAWNDVSAVDRVKMASGGAVSAASGKSTILADTNNATVRVGDTVGLTGDKAFVSGAGDIAMGARSIANISTQTSVDVWGLVGVAPAGDSVSSFKAVNAIEVGRAEMLALNDIRLNAGASADHNPAAGSTGETNDIRVSARTDVFNNTAIPVNRDPVADASIDTQSQIRVGAGAQLDAVRHVALYAEKGAATASGVGVGKDIYREALAAIGSAISNAFGGGDVSFETRTGTAVKTQASNVTVDGEVHVGTQRKQRLVIGLDGTVTDKTDGIGIASTGVSSLAQDIIDRIDALNELIRQYSGGAAGTDAAIAVAAYQSEIRFLQRKLFELGFKLDETGGVSFAGVAGISPLVAAQQAVTGMTATRTVYSLDRTTRTTANSNLTTANNNLTTANNNLSAANTTLQGEIATLTTQRNALPDIPANAAARQALQDQIDDRNDTILANNGTIDTNNGTITTNNGTIATNTAEINRLTPLITSLTGQIGNVQTDINNGVYSSTVTPGPTATFLTVSDTEAKLGNIYVRADALQGSGVLDAPGDAEIRITNNGPSFLILNKLSIPADEGGRIYLNSVDVQDNAQINGINGAAGGAGFDIFTTESTTDFSGSAVLPGKPKIVVESKYDPLSPFYIGQFPVGETPPAPDIIVRGDISNLRGLVKIDSAAGSIRLEETASIRADSVEVKTRNGDFVQSYSNTFSHVAGDPLTTIPGDPDLAFPGNIDRIQRGDQAGRGITANGSVLLAARYLNINGTVQSGIPEWGVRVPVDATVRVGASSLSFDAARSHYNALTAEQKAVAGAEYFLVDGATVSGLSGNQQGDWEGIEVSYNAKEDRLELSGVRVQGGYIEIFGQIFNTNQSGGGKLRVLDGYGQIKVDNESSKQLWVNLLDTGKGVKGEINITNISGVDASGVPIISTTQFVRDPGESRTGRFFDPQAGLRYTMTVGYDQGRVDYYRYSQSGWFGGAILGSKALDEFKIDSLVRSNDPLSQAEYLQVVSGDNSAVYSPTTSAVYGAGAITGGDQESIATAAPILTPGRSWRDCNWWTLCINATHYQEFTVTTATKTTITESMKADQRIGVEFIGFDQGTVDVASEGSVVINGAINNASGQTSVSSSGSITQNGDLNTISGQSITLAAGTGIGSATQAVQTNISDAGRLDATSGTGDVRIREMVGELHVGTVGGAGVGNVVLQSDKSILAFDAGSYIQGRRVELRSDNGGIGATGSPLTVRTGYTTNQTQWPNNGLMATARDSINLRNVADAANLGTYSGNLLLIAADSAVGDVRVETGGAVIDNNPFETVDNFTETQLADLWDELRLRGAPSQAKAQEAVDAYARGKDNDYRSYWQLRRGQADQGLVYDAGYAYQVSAAERGALEAAGLDATQIGQVAADRTSQYHRLHAQLDAIDGLELDSFDSTYHYSVSTAEADRIKKGATWTDAQLILSVGAGLLKNTTDTVTTVKAPNAKGRNVELIAGTQIGSFDDDLTIDLSAGLDTLTPAQKAALAAAERGDASVAGDIITIKRLRPVNVQTGSGALTATAGNGVAFIGSESDLRINKVTATGDARIKVAGSLINAALVAGANNIEARNLILESATGGIGSKADSITGAVNTALRISLGANDRLVARAAGDIWIDTPVNLNLDTVYSRTDARLEAEGSILDIAEGDALNPDLNVRSRNLTLTARTGSIGAAANPLDVGVNADGLVFASATTPGQGVYLNAPSGEHFNVGAISSGSGISLSAANDLDVRGPVSAPGEIDLSAGGAMDLGSAAEVHSTAGNILMAAATLTMADDGTAAARVHADTGSIGIETVGDMRITGIQSGNGTVDAVRLVSTAGQILDAGDTRLDVIADAAPSATLTLDGHLGVGTLANPLELRLRHLDARSALGSVALDLTTGATIGSVSAGDAVQIVAAGAITGDSVVSTGSGTQGSDKTVSVSSSGASVSLGAVSGTQDVTVHGRTGLDLGTVTSSGASVVLGSSEGDTVVGTVSAAQDATITADLGNVTVQSATAGNNIRVTAPAGAIDAGVLVAQRGGITLRALGGIAVDEAQAGRDIVIDSDRGPVQMAVLATRGSFRLDTRGSIELGRIAAGDAIELVSRSGSVAVQQARAGDTLAIDARRGIEAGTLQAGDDLALLSRGAGIEVERVVSRDGSVSLLAGRGIELGTGEAAGSFFANASNGDLDASQVAAQTVDLNASGNLDAGRLRVAEVLRLTGRSITADVTASGDGDVTGHVTGYGGGRAESVNLILRTPFAYRLGDLATGTGQVSLPSGDLYVERMDVGTRLTLENPQTTVLIDQTSRLIQDFDVQLYSGGNAFGFGLTGNRVLTSAFVVARDPLHEVVSPQGNNLSAAELADRELALAGAASDPFAPGGFGGPGSAPPTGVPPSPVSFSGFPVALEGAPATDDGDADCPPGDPDPKCKDQQ